MVGLVAAVGGPTTRVSRASENTAACRTFNRKLHVAQRLKLRIERGNHDQVFASAIHCRDKVEPKTWISWMHRTAAEHTVETTEA